MQRHTRREKDDKERSLKHKSLGCRVGCKSQPLHKRRFWKDFSQTKKSARLKDADKSGQQIISPTPSREHYPTNRQSILFYFLVLLWGRNPPFSKFKQRTDKSCIFILKTKED